MSNDAIMARLARKSIEFSDVYEGVPYSAIGYKSDTNLLVKVNVTIHNNPSKSFAFGTLKGMEMGQLKPLVETFIKNKRGFGEYINVN